MDSTSRSTPPRAVSAWEGEWLNVRIQAGKARECIQPVIERLMSCRTGTATAAIVVADSYVHGTATNVSRQLQGRAWLLPASGIAAVSSYIGFKSLRWGLGKALRNGVLAGAVLVCSTYPYEIKSALSGVMVHRSRDG